MAIAEDPDTIAGSRALNKKNSKRAALRSGPFLLDFKGMKTTASPSGEQAIEHRRP